MEKAGWDRREAKYTKTTAHFRLLYYSSFSGDTTSTPRHNFKVKGDLQRKWFTVRHYNRLAHSIKYKLNGEPIHNRLYIALRGASQSTLEFFLMFSMYECVLVVYAENYPRSYKL